MSKREPKPKVPEVVIPRGSIRMLQVLDYGEEAVTLGCYDCGSELSIHDRREFDALLYDPRAGDKKIRGGFEVFRWYRKRPTRKPKEIA